MKRDTMAENEGKSPLKMGTIGLVVILVVALLVIWDSYYIIEPEQRGVTLRLGKFTGISSPGWHLKVPFIDEVIPVTVKPEDLYFGFHRTGGVQGAQDVGPETQTEQEMAVAYMLTGDLNIVNVRWSVRYKVDETKPQNYLFNVMDVEKVIRDLTEAYMRLLVGNLTIDELITGQAYLQAAEEMIGEEQLEEALEEELGEMEEQMQQSQQQDGTSFQFSFQEDRSIKEQLRTFLKNALQDLLDQYNAGIIIIQINLLPVLPPAEVRDAFEEVNQAMQDKQFKKYEAQREYNDRIPRARGEAERMISQAEGYARERVNIARGEVSQYLAILEEYNLARDVTQRRLYLETMQNILEKVNNVVIVDENQQSLLPFLNLSEFNRMRNVAPQNQQQQ